MQPHLPLSRGARRFLTWTMLSWLGMAMHPIPAIAADSPERIYRQRCAKCHGASGEGTDENYPHRLAGDKSLAQLARFYCQEDAKRFPAKM